MSDFNDAVNALGLEDDRRTELLALHLAEINAERRDYEARIAELREDLSSARAQIDALNLDASKAKAEAQRAEYAPPVIKVVSYG